MRITRRVAFLPAGVDGCALWRMGLIQNRYPLSVYIECEPGQEIPIKYLETCDVCIVQRLATPGNFRAMELLHSKGKKIIYDLDDDFWSLPNYNPAHKVFRHPDIIRGLEKCAMKADVITVSTQYLASVVRRKLKRDPVIIENALDPDLFLRTRRPVKRDYILVGWAGTPTHTVDLDPAMNGLAEAMREREDIHVEFMGAGIPEQIARLAMVRKLKKGHRGEVAAELPPIVDVNRIGWRPWVHPRQYPAWFSNLQWDIILAPLATENQFNRCKSNIKMLEAASVGALCLASPAAEYKRFCGDNPVLQNLLCKNTHDWKKKLFTFTDNREMREQAILEMRKRLNERYLIDQAILKWNEVFENV